MRRRTRLLPIKSGFGEAKGVIELVKNFESVIIRSANATKLANFYKKKVGLKQSWDAVMGENSNVYGFTIGKIDLVIMDHPRIKGKNRDGARVVFNLEVDNIEKDFKKLKKAGVKVITDVYHIQDYGYLATLADADGNHFQLAKTGN